MSFEITNKCPKNEKELLSLLTEEEKNSSIFKKIYPFFLKHGEFNREIFTESKLLKFFNKYHETYCTKEALERGWIIKKNYSIKLYIENIDTDIQYVIDENGNALLEFRPDGRVIKCINIPSNSGWNIDSNGTLIIE